MPRTKAEPTKKRPRDDVPAAPSLDTTDVEALIESAEVSGFEQRIASGACAPHDPSVAKPEGLVRLPRLAEDVFEPLRGLHELICRRLAGDLTGWGGVGDLSGPV